MQAQDTIRDKEIRGGGRRLWRGLAIFAVALVPAGGAAAVATAARSAHTAPTPPSRHALTSRRVRPNLAANPDCRNAAYSSKAEFTFSEATPPASAVSRSQAISAARGFSDVVGGGDQPVPAGVTESAYYGTYADCTFSPRSVWIVTYTGTGVDLMAESPFPLPGRPTYNPPHMHAEAVVVDATDGTALLSQEDSSASAWPVL